MFSDGGSEISGPFNFRRAFPPPSNIHYSITLRIPGVTMVTQLESGRRSSSGLQQSGNEQNLSPLTPNRNVIRVRPPYRQRGIPVQFKLHCRLCSWALLFCVAAAIGVTAQTYTVIATLTGGNAYPTGNLIQGVNGNLYGTSYGNAASNEYGTVFEVSTSGTVSTLYTFCSKASCADGSFPAAGLILANDQNFYGTTTSGGAYGEGTVFKLTPSGTLTTLYSFCQDQTPCADGANPYGGLVQGTSGLLYGTTALGGEHALGSVFSIGTNGEMFTTLYSFCDGRCSIFGLNDGSAPESALVQDSNGNFYGTTSFGTIFEITPQGTLTTLYEFCSLPSCEDGNAPWGNPALSSDGILYGAATKGGVVGGGVVWSLQISTNIFIDFNDFGGSGGAEPNGVVVGSNGNVYGTSLGAIGRSGVVYPATIYEISPTAFTVLYTFCQTNGCPDGGPPLGELVEATNGVFYGASTGTVFSLSDGLAPFVMSVPSFGKPGNKVRILGTNLKGSTTVSFNGKAATFSVNSSSEITAEVPTGAKTGQIQVQTPGGKLKSNVVFTIL
jgi:uncharacterized repeat protein (TIGR03803 family)